VPWSALPVPGDGRPLLEEHEVVLAWSASVLARRRATDGARSPADLAVAVLADPVFAADDARIAGRATATETGAVPAIAVATAAPPVRLRYSRDEARDIVALAGSSTSFLALDTDASRDAALGPEVARARIVHFATHGRVDARDPSLSGLLLSSYDEEGGERAGFLGLADVRSMKLSADLVVLSACQTALGREVRGEGFLGLSRAFFLAGARVVIASLWRVDDLATAALRNRLYTALLRRGERPAAALREAARALRRDPRWRAPYYWAAFVAHGDWR
jgi:CHAT domain-containing protein